MMKLLTMCAAFAGVQGANSEAENTCPKMTVMFLRKYPKWIGNDGGSLENAVIIAPPGMYNALMVRGKNVKLRNLLIYHSSSGRGIYAWNSDNLEMENVEVHTYGTEWGPNPCPKSHLGGYACYNIGFHKSNNIKAHNIRTTGGATGIHVSHSLAP